MRVKMRVREGFLRVSRGFGPPWASTARGRRTDFCFRVKMQRKERPVGTQSHRVQIASEGLLTVHSVLESRLALAEVNRARPVCSPSTDRRSPLIEDGKKSWAFLSSGSSGSVALPTLRSGAGDWPT